MSGWGGEGGGGTVRRGGEASEAWPHSGRHGRVLEGAQKFRGRRNSECALLERLSMAQLGVKRKCCGCMYMYSKPFIQQWA